MSEGESAGAWLLEAGPFSARSPEGRVLFTDLGVRLPAAALTLLEGRSGSGKSTLLRHLVGLAETAATRTLQGEEYRQARLPLWRSRVTLLAQDAPMLPGTVADNLAFPFALGCNRQRCLDPMRRDSLLAATGLAEIELERNVQTLSGGERHRLALVRGLLSDPPVLVADEPLAGLDPQVAADCFALLLEHAHRPGRAVLCTLHDPALGSAADHRLVLDPGVAEDGS